MIQQIWRMGLDWDDPIDGDLARHWGNWLDSAKEMSQIRIDRCYLAGIEAELKRIELHIFCDASELAFGSIAYLRYCLLDVTFWTAFVIAKANLAPIKVMTLPRLELSYAVSAVRFYKSIIRDTVAWDNQGREGVPQRESKT